MESRVESSRKEGQWLARTVYGKRLKAGREALNLALVVGNVAATMTLSLYYQTVPRQDLLLVLVIFLYLSVSNAIIPRSQPGKTLVPLSLSAWVQVSILIALLACLLLPWLDIYLTGADRDVLQLVSPSAFCFSSQILVEFWFYKDSSSVLVRILVPVIFNAYRIAKAYNWLEKAVFYDNYQLALAAVNFLFTVFTLFYVLLLRVLPIYVNPIIRLNQESQTPSQG
mmetsp:Transcript_24946/g.98511  ORF Transcript_24946/g.98511 Transcript_24946/m.98511 type:complete len:226 (-) Transcript_24946:4057-4734(-)